MLSRIWPRSRNHSPRNPKNGSRPFRRALHECLEARTLLATYVVANVSDGGLGSLRQAILDANSHAGPDQIDFAIPGAGPHTIQPSTALPAITDPVSIDGTTQPGSIRNSLANGDDAVLKIELDGSLARSAHGLWITAGNSNVRGLVINRFAGDGIRLETLGGNIIEGNFIGVDPTGQIARGNGTSGIGQPAASFLEFESAFGIEIVGGSSDNFIGTNGDNIGDVGERNVISSNIKADVFISGIGTNRNVVAGNFIGTNAAGTGSFGPVAQGGYSYNVGVFINGGSQSNRVGTDGNGTADAAERNIISGHFGNTGRADDHHSSRGVEIANLSSPATTLGLNVVAGNYIGTDVTGTRKLGNSIGVGMQLGDRNRIGTNSDGLADAAERNLISGNGVAVHLFGSNQNTVAGNYVGTDVTGTTNTGMVAGDLGNSTGIWILSSASNTVGGTAVGAGNLVSGNTYYGMQIQGNNNPGNSGADSNTVQGNLIGTDATGTVALSNGGYGLYLNSNSNLIGGNTTAARNVISASGNVVGGDGIHVVGYSNVIQGNYIGTDISGSLPLGNSGSPNFLQGNGIRVLGGTGNRIGGPGTGEGNLIAFNVGAGIMISGYDPTGNAIRGNSIHSNSGLGIDLAPWAAGAAGVSYNDLGDLDLGPNDYQNFPLLASVHSSVIGTTISGTLNSTPLTTFTLDFYANVAADPSGYGEGETYLGSANVTTDINGGVTFNVTVSGVAPVGQFISATATNSGSTSEFSGLTTVIAGFMSGNISGHVYVDADNDAVFNTGEARLFGVTVNLIGIDDRGPVSRSTSTDVLGEYHFDNLRTGNYQIVETQPSGYLDGKESIGNLGGTLANDIFFLELGADENARDYNFGELIEAKLSGYVFDDFDDDGQLDFGEGAVANVVISLDGVNDLGQLVHLIASTDSQGYFEFEDLRPGTYSLTEQQRSGYLDGKDTLGSQGGTLGNDQFASIRLKSGDNGMNYNFGDHADIGLHRGQTATIGYWQNKNGQALISSLNGGPNSTSLGNWLASQFPNMYGVDASDKNLTGKTNAQVAAFYVTLFKAKGPKIDAQVMATAMAVYVTNTNLAGSNATAYGFQVSSAGTGAAIFSVGTSGTAFGVANGTRMTILQILSATNERAVRGKLYNGATSLQNLAIVVFDGINQGGDIL